MTPRKRGRPKTRSAEQSVHLRLAHDVYDQLKQWSVESGVPMNTIIERSIQAAIRERKLT